MKTLKNITSKALLAGLACMLMLSGCSQEEPNLKPDGSGTDKEVVFSINIPGAAASGTRALGNGEENEVTSIEMLLFNSSTKVMVHNPVFANVITPDPNDATNVTKKSFSVRLPQGTYDIMIFANARAVFNSVTLTSGEGQEAILSKLKFSMPSGGWKANPSDPSKGYLIPMWGMKQNVAVGLGTSITGVYLHRMVSRIDVKVTGANAQTGNFSLKDIKVYNVQKEGRVAPVLANWNAGGVVNNSVPAGLAMSPSLVPGCGVYPSISYASAIAQGGKGCEGEIYLFEASKATGHADLNAPYLTVKGAYNGVEGWYRLDLADYSTMSYLHVLRNHFYKVSITKVTGAGYATEEEAKNNRGDNIVVDVTLWNDYDLDGTIFNGQYFLSINPLEKVYDENAHTGKILTIKTDCDASMTVAANIKVSDSGTNPNAGLSGNWISNLSLSPKSVVNNMNVYTLTYNVSPNNGNTRKGYIHVSIDRLTIAACITQEEPSGTITVTPAEWLLPYTIPANKGYAVLVSCKKNNGQESPNAPWTLTSDTPSWCRLSANSTAAFGTATASITGNGSTTVYIIPASNSSVDPRTALISITSALGTDPATVVRQWGDPGVITDNQGGGTPPDNALTCVGAFWKADQKGERLIRIQAQNNPGTWTAKVMWLDARWDGGNGDGVVLSTDTSLDPNRYTANPGDAESYPVNGYATTITGSVVSGYINFRIGLKTTYTPTVNYPVRYAVVLLSYANNTRQQKIFLRQGEGADYLMMSGDNGISRPKSVKFSPYNVTANTLDARVDKQGVSGSNPSKFTDFPTQSGGFFQWANAYAGGQFNGGQRWIYAPHKSASDIQDYTSPFSGGEYWNNVGNDNETCPAGYRRPNDGSTSTEEPTGNVLATSEVRQSLFNNPIAGFNYNNYTCNSAWGYYADGYFDRRPIQNDKTVASNSAQVACIGRLFFNANHTSDRYNASIFFPAAGWLQKSGSTGTLIRQGDDAMYWTSTVSTVIDHMGIVLRFREYNAETWRQEFYQCNTIRCVKN